jgi:hypothetical protein
LTSPTCAARARRARLLADLGRYVAASEPTRELDFRDVLVGLAPYYDCADRLGMDPIALHVQGVRAHTGMSATFRPQGKDRTAKPFARSSGSVV